MRPALVVFAALGPVLSTPTPAATPAYVQPDGSIAIAGYNDMRDMVRAWDRLFAAEHPGVRFSLRLSGTRPAPAALAAGTTFLAPMGAEFTAAQMAAYRREVDEDPLAVRVAQASVSPRAKSGPLAVFVHPGNPVDRLTLAQFRRVFTSTLDGRDAFARWGRLDADGAWGERPIHAYGLAPTTAIGDSLFQHLWRGRREAPGFRPSAESDEVVRRVAADPLGIGFGRVNTVTAGVKLLAVGADDAGPFLLPTSRTVADGRYPLGRYLYVYLRRVRGRPPDPLAVAYVRLILSPAGQRAVARTPQRYLPLTASELAAEQAKLTRCAGTGPSPSPSPAR